MITQETIDAVYETARVEEVIGDYVQLKKAGSNFKGLSPFSDERTPSFMVSPVKQIWKDFSSGKGGNVVAFLMEHEHFSYPEAIKYLAKKYGIEIIETEQSDVQKEQANERESMYLVSEFANSFFQEQLQNTELGKAIAKTYFKERGFTEETIKKFQLGYSPDIWDAFTKEALAKQYDIKYLEATGLTIVKEEKQFDRFKGRVIFPIHSMSGRVLGFGGRILKNDKKAAKYLNSPESDIYHKSKVLYGIYYAKQTIAKENNCYLVEGYTDVIQFHQIGVANTVSSSGTALTSEQIRLINRLTKNITVLFDGDAAGIRAATRGIDLILEQGMNVRVCTFLDGEDPDSFAKTKTEEEVKSYLKENQQDFIRFKATLLQQEAKNDPIKKAELVRDMVGSISKIPDAIQREIYVKECSAIMQISEEVLFSNLAQLTKASEKEYKKQQKKQKTSSLPKMEVSQAQIQKVDRLFELEKAIISVLLLYGQEEEIFEEAIYKENDEGELILEFENITAKVYEKVFLDLQMDEVAFSNPSFQKVYALLIEALNTGNLFKVDQFINQLTPELSSEITHILMQDEKYQLSKWDSKEIYVKEKHLTIPQYVSDIILNLRHHLVNLKIEQLMTNFKDMPDIQNSLDDTSHNKLEEIMEYQTLKKVISKKLNRVL